MRARSFRPTYREAGPDAGAIEERDDHAVCGGRMHAADNAAKFHLPSWKFSSASIKKKHFYDIHYNI